MIKDTRNNNNFHISGIWYLHIMQGISSAVHNEDELYEMGKVTFRVNSNSDNEPSIHVSKKSFLCMRRRLRNKKPFLCKPWRRMEELKNAPLTHNISIMSGGWAVSFMLWVLGKKHPVHIEYEASWAPELIWMLWSTEITCPYQELNSVPLFSSP